MLGTACVSIRPLLHTVVWGERKSMVGYLPSYYWFGEYTQGRCQLLHFELRLDAQVGEAREFGNA